MSQMVIDDEIEFQIRHYNQQFYIPTFIKFKLHNLENFKTNLTTFENIRFQNPKILYIDWDELQSKTNNSNITYGFYMSPIKNTGMYKISLTAAYNDGFTFDEHQFTCAIYQCEIGYVIFDKKLNTEKLNEKGNIYTVEYVVLVVIKSLNNIIVLQEVDYHKMNINIGLCPYINWVSKKGPVKF
ncbi:Hypothetical protein SRAE_0000081400, partial [Strongyloides ratti]